MKNLIEFLDLGYQPLANEYIAKKNFKKKEKKYRLVVCFNKKNHLISIKKTFSSKSMFNNKYPYRSSLSKTVNKSFKNLSIKIKKNYKFKKILEIGSNDGCFLKNFKKKQTVGIEPCKNVERITKKKNFNTFAKYWDRETASYLKKKFGKFDIVFSANTLSHIKNLDNVFSSINFILKENGILILEDPSVLDCLKKVTYDQFYNEHIYVFSYLSLKTILKKNNLKIFKIENLDIHGGTNRYYIKKNINPRKVEKSVLFQEKKELAHGLNKLSTYKKFAKKAKISKNKLVKIFKKLKKQGKKVIGYGATAKSVTILNYCKINSEYIDYFLDTTPAKKNMYMPGTKIFIKKYHKKIPDSVDFAFLGAWNFKNEILYKEKKFLKKGGKFITHTPYPRIL